MQGAILSNDNANSGGSTPPTDSNTLNNDNKDPDKDPNDKNKEIADKIGAGHAYDKHKSKFPDIDSKEELKQRVQDIMNNPDEKKPLERGRTGYWDSKTGTVVIENPNDPDGGTVFRPDEGKQYFEDLK